MPLAVQFTDTITLGAMIVGGIGALFALVVFGYGARWKAAYEAEHAAAASLMDGRQAFQLRAERVEAELKESTKQREESLRLIGEQRETIAKLESLPNLQKILETIGDMSVKQDAAADVRGDVAISRVETFVSEQLAHHEKRAMERHEAQMRVMETMVERLNGGTT